MNMHQNVCHTYQYRIHCISVPALKRTLPTWPVYFLNMPVFKACSIAEILDFEVSGFGYSEKLSKSQVTRYLFQQIWYVSIVTRSQTCKLLYVQIVLIVCVSCVCKMYDCLHYLLYNIKSWSLVSFDHVGNKYISNLWALC